MMLKRAFDFVFALILLVLLFPFLLLIALAVRLTSRGPVIYCQRRIGYLGRSFVMYKFRSMYDRTEKEHDQVLPGDDRITVVGKMLRKTHMDELPQLWNIILGDMSLVGPRPHTLEIFSRLENLNNFQLRHCVLPGLTGPVQVRGRMRNIKSWGLGLRLDLLYAAKRNSVWDMKLLFETLKTVCKMKGV